MVGKWTLCIDVSCYPNPGQVIIEYVLHNKDTNEDFQRKTDICGRTMNNEAYYIALIGGIKNLKPTVSITFSSTPTQKFYVTR